MGRKLGIGVALLMAGLALGIAGCKKPSTGAADGADPVAALVAQAVAAQHLTMNNDTEPKTLDPAVSTGVTESRIIDELFEGLVRQDPKTLAPIPGVAARWEISADGLTYTFYLRDNAKWSDGTAVTAADFAYSWERALNPSFGAQYAYQLFPIRNAEAYNAGTVTAWSDVGVQVESPHKLVVTLHSPCPYFLDLAAFTTLSPVPKQAVQAHGDQWTQPGNLVANGPFMLDEWKPRERIELLPNPHYWDREQVHLKRITMLPYDKAETAQALYDQGKILWVPGIPLNQVDELKRHPDYYRNPYFGTYFYRFNTARPPFDDARVRRAFSLAIDRSVITTDIVRFGETPAGWFCPSVPVAGYEHIPGVTYDAAAAKRLLAEAGYGPGGKELPPIEISYNTQEAHKLIAEYIAQQWQTVLGATVSTRNMEWKVYLDEMDNMEYQVIRSSWIGDYSDPNTFLDMFVTDGGNNRTGWSSPQYDAWLKEAQQTTDTAARNAIFQKMERLLVEEEAVVAPLYMYVSKGMLRSEVTGWYDNIRDKHPLKSVRLAPQP